MAGKVRTGELAHGLNAFHLLFLYSEYFGDGEAA